MIKPRAGRRGLLLIAAVLMIVLNSSALFAQCPTDAVISGSSSVCSGTAAVIRVNITGGVSPYSVVYSDGKNNNTITNYVSGSDITLTPADSTWYTLVSVADANNCSAGAVRGLAYIYADHIPVLSPDTYATCSGLSSQITLRSGYPYVSAYQITSIVIDPGLTAGAGNVTAGSQINYGGIAGDVFTNTTQTILHVVYTVTGKNALGCAAQSPGKITISVSPAPVMSTSLDLTVCSGVAIGLVLKTAPGSVPASAFDVLSTTIPAGLIVSGVNYDHGFSVNANFLATSAFINSTPLAQVVNYTVDAVTAAGCQSAPVVVAVTINPAPLISSGLDESICSGLPTSILLTTGSSGAIAKSFNIVSETIAAGLIAGPVNHGTGIGASANALATDAFVNQTESTLAVKYNVSAVSANGCVGAPSTITVTISPSPLLKNLVIPPVCDLQNGAFITYDQATNQADHYSIAWSSEGTAAGLANVTNASLIASPIPIDIGGSAAYGTYDGYLTVTSPGGSCPMSTTPVQLTIGSPGVDLLSDPFACTGASEGRIVIGLPRGNPDKFDLVFDADALAAGFTDIHNATLTPELVKFPIASTTPAGYYNAILNVSNSVSSCRSLDINIYIIVVDHADAPSSLIDSIGETNAIVSWERIPSATSYIVDLSTDNFQTFISEPATDQTQYNMEGLTPSTEYQVRFHALGSPCQSDYSGILDFKTLTSLVDALPPTDVGNRSFTAKWDPVAGAINYFFDLSADNFVTFVPGYHALPVTATTLLVSNLSAGTVYQYRVSVNNSLGNAVFSNTVSLATITDAPVATAPSGIQSTTFNANWNAVTGADGYVITVATDAAFTSVLTDFSNKVVGKVTTVQVTGSASYQNYYYKVVATNASGNSAASNVVHVTLVVTGLEPANDGISVYPNPGSERIYISGAISEQTIVSLFDGLGRLVAEMPVIISGEHKSFLMTLLPAGIYIVRINSGHDQFVRKLIKQSP